MAFALVERREWADGALRTFISFEPNSDDVASMKAKWNEISSLFPETGKPAYSSSGSEFWVDRNDIQKYFIERRLALGAFSSEQIELAKTKIKELSEMK